MASKLNKSSNLNWHTNQRVSQLGALSSRGMIAIFRTFYRLPRQTEEDSHLARGRFVFGEQLIKW